MKEDQYTVSRQFAAEILNVSTRTLDRYAKKDAISSVRRGRQLFFSEQNLLDFKAQVLAKQEVEQVKQKKKAAARQSRGKRTDFVEVEAAQVMEQASSFDEVDGEFAQIRDSLLRRSPEESIFKSLYEKAEGELKGLRHKLEMANYQVGKLEAQVKSMVPLLDYKKQKQAFLVLEEEHQAKQDQVKQLEKDIRLEQFVKKIYAAFLFFMMALMPLLVILRVFAS